jgi:hypothetical protein
MPLKRLMIFNKKLNNHGILINNLQEDLINFHQP